MTKRGMLVEFIGPNGSGKETVITKLVHMLTGEGQLARSVDLRSPQITAWRAAMRSPGFACQALLFARRGARFGHIVRRDAAARQLPHKGFTFVHEGPRHGLLSIAARDEVGDIRRLFRLLHQPDVVVAVRCGIEQLTTRLRQKHAEHWVHRYADEQIRARLERYIALQADAVSVERAPVLVIENNTSRPEDAAALLAKQLLRQAGEGGAENV